ncbi:putative Tetratricopeptide TPR_1 repeat-containing protein [uncultured Woeseiaceae bacterium]|uniref:Putative Tetratricopeptide TPR_1 repeat-containing protein n=1 Tax=uncultured Woeseiaceae bacterium TaxID=1983305 RepID=A0A7D9H3U3_9GAMM|nr:putative Tetratricopeptide TPR_1 repeat-containing protein [uncultured Woeseiaceae bacterium]
MSKSLLTVCFRMSAAWHRRYAPSCRIAAGLVPIFIQLVACGPLEISQPTVLVAAARHEISADLDVTFDLKIGAETNLLVSAKQEKIDVGISITSPDGDQIIVNSPIERDGTETLLHRTSETGIYQIRIFSLDHQFASGHVLVSIEGLGHETKGDQIRLEAEQAESQGAEFSLAATKSEDSVLGEKLYRDGAMAYKAAASDWATLKRPIREALSLYREALLQYILADWEAAENSAMRSANILTNAGRNPLLRARVLHLQGQILIETLEESDIERALNVLNEALIVQRDHDDQFNAAVTLNTLGILDYERGDLTESREKILEAGRIQEALNEEREASKTYNNVATIDERRGQVLLALDSYEKAARLSKSVGADYEYAVILENSADAHAILGNMEKALIRYHEAADVAERIGDRLGVAQAMDGIGNVYYRLGNWQSAARYLERSLELHANASERRPLLETHTHLGNTYRSTGQYQQAIEEHELALNLAGRRAEQAMVHLELGRDKKAAKDFTAALAHFDRTLHLAKNSADTILEASALTEIGAIRAVSSPIEGIEELNAALSLHRQISSNHGEIQTLSALASAHQRVGKTKTALEYANQALVLTEELRTRIGHPRLRYTYSGLQSPTFGLVIDLLMDLNSLQPVEQASDRVDYDALALEISELAHASTLVELMYEAGGAFAQSAGQALRQQHRELRQRLAQIAYMQEKDKASLTRVPNEDEFEHSLISIASELDVIEAKIHSLNPQSQLLARPKKLRATEIQNLLGGMDDKDSVLLEYSLGDQRSFVWAVTSTSINGWVLPGRRTIEKMAQEVYLTLKTPQHSSGASGRRQELRALSDILLGPVTEHLEVERIIVVPDGTLHYVPFSALLVPNKDIFLVEHADIVTLPSASVLAAQRNIRRNRITAPKGIAIIADPVFELSDKRLSKMHNQRESSVKTQAITRAGAAASLPRLPYTANEAASINEITSGWGENLTLTGFDANRAELLASPLGQYQIIHFASHGLIDSEQPQLSAIAMSAYDSAGNEINSLLQLDDIYELQLNADLVVLSACDTALGVNVRGEGLVGLVHAFMYAGARSVVGSLWSVQDNATSILMENFYSNLLDKKMSPDSALRYAQLAVAKERAWRDPYYWAAFTYQGEWRR